METEGLMATSRGLKVQYRNSEREIVVDFTRGYYTSSQGVIGASGSAMISDALDLNAAGTRVAVQSGTTSDLWTAENLPDATVVAYADFPSVTASISNGDADYAIGDSPVMALSGELMVTFSDETFGLAVDDGDSELLDALNVAITAVIDSGEYDLIFSAWFEGAVVLTDDRDAGTATAYPMATEGSRLTQVLESGNLKFCSDTSYPPFESLNADGNAEGFDVDIGNAIADEMAAHYMSVSNPMFVPPVVEPPVVEDVTIKIGLLNPITGPISQFAPPFTFAAAQAIADLNAANDGYNFEIVDTDVLFGQFEEAYQNNLILIEQELPLPAYEQIIKASHIYNLLDSRSDVNGKPAILDTDRDRLVRQVRSMSHNVARAYYKSRERLGFPMLNPYVGVFKK